MKQLSLFFCLLWAVVSQAQVKIGENPQTIDPSSVLELESTSKALVITRVTTEDMEKITSPLPGAMVYNLDVGCIHYFNSTEWVNICDAVAGSVTFASEDKTIVITANGNDYDFKVGKITGDHIKEYSIRGINLVDGDISNAKLAPLSVRNINLDDEVIGSGLRRTSSDSPILRGPLEVNVAADAGLIINSSGAL
ncbi:MAG TPA: hypothetical protein VLZ54_09305, partial [Arenibacter sp.]|nr:hypothetical protein [Arenibacter sp.]